MQLIHIERVSATSDDERLGFLLTARAKAAEQVVAANLRAQACKVDLIEHITRRIQDGADRLRLRHRLLESGMPPSIVGRRFHQYLANRNGRSAGNAPRWTSTWFVR